MIEIKFYWDLFLQTLVVAAALGTVTMLFIQKTKSLLPTTHSIFVIIYSLIINLAFGYLYSVAFTNASLTYSIWIGLFSFIGADSIYKALETTNLVTQFKSMKNSNTIEVLKENYIDREGY